jgi:hypothetical protein
MSALNPILVKVANDLQLSGHNPELNEIFDIPAPRIPVQVKSVPLLVPMRKFAPVGGDLMYTGFTGDLADGNSDPEDDNDDQVYISDEEEEIPDSEYARQTDAEKTSADPDNDIEHLAANTELLKRKSKGGAVTVEDGNNEEEHEDDNKDEHVHDDSCEHDAHYEENQEYRKLMEAEFKAKANNVKNQRTWKSGAVDVPLDDPETVDVAVDVLRALKLYHRITAPADNTDMFSSITKFSEDTKDSLNSSYAPAGNQVNWKPEYLLRVDGIPSQKANSIIPLIQWILEHEPQTWAVEQLVESGSMSQQSFSGTNHHSGSDTSTPSVMQSIAEGKEEERDM